MTKTKKLPDTFFSLFTEDSHRESFKTSTITMLRRNTLKIEFIKKKDGELREMNVTLDPTITPLYEKKTERVKVPNPEVQAVYDVDAKAWKSFRWDSLTSFTIGCPNASN